MKAQTIKFNVQDRPEFYKELRDRVNQYFKEKNISKHADLNMKFKTAFMIGLHFIPFTLMLTEVFTSFWGIFSMWILMGLGMAGIGLSIMHDANHGSYSKNRFVNKSLSFLLNFVGGYHVTWSIQHNVLHHSFTNIDGHDEDIQNGLMRFTPSQKRKGFNRFQAYYAPFLYCLMTTYWLVAKDHVQLFRYKKKDLLKTQNIKFTKALLEVTFNKIWYVVLVLGLPIYFVESLSLGELLIGFFAMQCISGIILALIFQPAHVIEETKFFEHTENKSMEDNWAIHQMKTTSNFANGSRIFSWLIGGLNYQVEHHLFPNICHVHYRGISSIVKQTAKEFNVPYYHHRTFWTAIKSHFSMLNQLGTGSYDKKLMKT